MSTCPPARSVLPWLLAASCRVALSQCPVGLEAAFSYDAGVANRGVIADLDLDGKLDVAVAPGSLYNDMVVTRRGNGDGTFGPPIGLISLAREPIGLAAGDLNGDSRTDLVVASDGGYVDAYDNHPLGWRHAGRVDVGADPTWISLADLDANATLDLVAANRGDDSVSVRLGLGDGSFGTETVLAAGPAPTCALPADLDGDGIVDLAIASSGAADIHVRKGLGGGAFAAPLTYHVGNNPYEIVVGRFDADPNVDIAVTLEAPAQVVVLRGLGGLGFGLPEAHPAGVGARGLAAVDLDGDADLDLAVSSFGGISIGVLLGRGDGTFDDPVEHVTGPWSRGILPADLDDDAVTDLVVVHQWSLGVALGNGDGTLRAASAFPAGRDPVDVAALDADRDGNVDLAVTSELDGVTLLEGRGDGTFQVVAAYPGPTGLLNVAAGDWNGDASPDLAVADAYLGGVWIALNAGDGLFGSYVMYPANASPDDVRSADLDGDGDQDLLVRDAQGNGTLSLLRGNADGTFQPGTGVGTSFVRNFDLGDLDGDGDLDIVAAKDGDEVIVNLANGDGTFQSEYVVLVASNVLAAAIGTLDAGSVPDLVAASRGDVQTGEKPALHVLLGNGDGTFDPSSRLPSDDVAGLLSLADVTQDGILDAVFSGNARVTVFPISAGGVLGPSHGYAAAGVELGTNGHQLESADMDGDGEADLAVLSYGPDTVTILPSRRLRLADADLPPGEVGIPYAATLGAAHGQPPVTFVLSQGSLPPGTSLSPGGVISGVPTATGRFPFVVEACDARGCESARGYAISIGEHAFLAGAGAGEPNPNRVAVHHANGTPTGIDFSAYGAGHWGANVAAGQIDGALLAEILTAPGPGAVFAPHVRGFDAGGTPRAKVSFFAYGTLRYGANVHAGSVDADLMDEIVTGAGPGAVFGPHVRGFDHDGLPVVPIPGLSFFAYSTLKYGVEVASGSVDADAFAELLTGPGPGPVFGPQVRGFDVDGTAVSSIADLQFFAFATRGYGVHVAGGDVDADGRVEILAAPGPDPAQPARFRGFAFDPGGVRPLPGFDVVLAGAGYGGRVGSGDVSGDDRADLIAAAGPDPNASSRIEAHSYESGALVLLPGAFEPFPSKYGSNVAAGRLGP